MRTVAGAERRVVQKELRLAKCRVDFSKRLQRSFWMVDNRYNQSRGPLFG